MRWSPCWRDPADVGLLAQSTEWERAGTPKVAPWTDDYSDLMGAILRKKLR